MVQDLWDNIENILQNGVAINFLANIQFVGPSAANSIVALTFLMEVILARAVTSLACLNQWFSSFLC
jgi:hypothetical protein